MLETSRRRVPPGFVLIPLPGMMGLGEGIEHWPWTGPPGKVVYTGPHTGLPIHYKANGKLALGDHECTRRHREDHAEACKTHGFRHCTPECYDMAVACGVHMASPQFRECAELQAVEGGGSCDPIVPGSCMGGPAAGGGGGGGGMTLPGGFSLPSQLSGIPMWVWYALGGVVALRLLTR